MEMRNFHWGWRGVVTMIGGFVVFVLGWHFIAALIVVAGAVMVQGYAHDRLN